MDIDQFWTLIERSGEMHADVHERTRWLQTTLALLRGEAIVDFAILLDQSRRRADQWVMWAAANLIMGGYCSGDAFFYFQPWLIGLEREDFERVVAEPDELAELPQVRRLAGVPMSDWSGSDWPQWESVNYVPFCAYQRLLGPNAEVAEAVEARGYRRRSDPRPSGSDSAYYEPAITAARLPRLSLMTSSGVSARNPAPGQS